MSEEARAPLVSINIPCYHQLPLARRAVESALTQSFTDLEIILHDDGASNEYSSYVESLRDPRVSYRRNRDRLGAMRNMFAAIESGRGKYTMAFHEDDLLGSDYIAAAVNILEGHPHCGLVACELREFEQEPSADELTRPAPRPAFDMFGGCAEFVRGIYEARDADRRQRLVEALEESKRMVAALEEAKKVSPEVMRMVIDI